jgi:hypothetical protein
MARKCFFAVFPPSTKKIFVEKTIYNGEKSESLACAKPCKLDSRHGKQSMPKQGCQIVIFSNQKIPIWINFGGPLFGKGWYIPCPFAIFLAIR